MDGWKQLLVLLLPLCLCVDHRVTVVKTISREPGNTPVCTSADLGLTLLVKCVISTGMHQEDECYLLHTGNKHIDQCDSRFMLLDKNHTIFIHLASLTPMDSGNYTCVCSYERGTHIVHFNFTIADEDKSTVSGLRLIAELIIAVIVFAMFIITAGIICDHILRQTPHREKTSSGVSELTRSETPWPWDDHYTSLQQPASDVYEIISPSCTYHPDQTNTYAMTNCFNNQETNGKEKNLRSVSAVYESIFD